MTNLEKLLIKHEGLKLKPYRCPAGKMTIGVGRNLDDRGVTKEEAMIMLTNDIESILAEMRTKVPGFNSLSQARRDVLASMAFNMGVAGLMGFKNMLAAIHAKDWKLAASCMLASVWAKQVPSRAKELSAMMLTGEYPT